MVHIRVSGEQLRRQRIRGIGNVIVHGTLDVVKEVLDYVPMSHTRIGSERCELANRVSNVWASGAGQILQ